ncbi:dihydrofolate reductase family protein [Mucilaginibacter agri]|uniref:Dihydrofolate reductase n=1 Tax=Mucilaginibacter agri TaxID=2695265 RepID=A0A965ZIC3_9SPHI|nr:dihydrofolate reductase family protein [Mucilaginibacter agri]NCD70262.1 dihydrofolate reductase [Mucilaginibacter agri]
MRKLILFMHTSIDGFTARPKGEMDWVTVNEEMFEYAYERTQKADTALYGRGTYGIMQAYWPTAADKPNASKHDVQHATWYNKVEKYVVSATMRGQTLPNATIISDDVADRVNQLKQQPGGEIIMFGSPNLAQYLMQHNLIDEYWLFVNPIILGKGISLFNHIQEQIKLKLVEQIALPGGVVCLHYAKE